MLCERCRTCEATERLSEVIEGAIRAGHLCRACYLIELGPVDARRTRRLLEIERLLPGADFSVVARELAEQAAAHRQELPAEVLAFVERHSEPRSASA